MKAAVSSLNLYIEIKKMKWYSAGLIQFFQFQSQDIFPFWENVVLFKAKSLEEARIKASNLKVLYSGYDVELGDKITKSICSGYRQLLPYIDHGRKPREGSEIYSSTMILKSKKDINRLICGKPVYVSRCEDLFKNIKIESKNTEIKNKMVKNPWAAHIILYAEYINEKQNEYVVWEKVVILNDGSSKKAEAYGKEYEGHITINQKKAKIKYAGFRKINCFDYGVYYSEEQEKNIWIPEATWSYYLTDSKEDYKNFVKGKDTKLLYKE